MIIEQLYATLLARKQADPRTSYVASLYDKGLNKILEKVGEEAVETLLAAKDVAAAGKDHLIYETADLWFHCLVMLAHLDIPAEAILQELQRRMGQSGLTEKANRTE